MLSNTIAEGENKDFENKISELEVQKDENDTHAEELRAGVGDL